MKAKLCNITSLLLDTNSKLVAEIRRRNWRVFLKLKSESLTKKHIKLFKIQRQLENEFEYKNVTIIFWLDNKTQKRIAEYKIDSAILAWILSNIRLFSITKDGDINEIRKRIFEHIQKIENIDWVVKEIY